MPDSCADVLNDIRSRVGPGRRVAFVSGNFNILHPGHIRLLRFAAESADALLVGVNRDGASGATLPQLERLEAVKALSLVDEAFLMEEDVVDVIAKLRPDVVVKGKEYEARDNVEQAVVQVYGGRLLFSSGEVRYSSSSLLIAETRRPTSSIRKPREYLQRHGFDVGDIRHALKPISGLKVLVIGDLIVDDYVDCDPVGMSQEDPTLVVTPIEERRFLGGAGIVAAHGRGLGAEVQFLSVVGDDPEAEFARATLETHGVNAELVVDSTRPTTLKRRYRARDKTMLRVNRLRQHPVDQEVSARLLARAAELLPKVDVLLFSDFNYGCLPQPLVDALIGIAQVNQVVLGADSQASSQLSDISRYKGMDLITPTEREARLALRDFESGLVIVAEELQKRARARHVLITLGAEGLLAYAEKEGEFLTDRLPAFNDAPKDPAGAGDSLFTTAMLALAGGADFWRTAYLGALAAACQVSRIGNVPLTCNDLLTELDALEA